MRGRRQRAAKKRASMALEDGDSDSGGSDSGSPPPPPRLSPQRPTGEAGAGAPSEEADLDVRFRFAAGLQQDAGAAIYGVGFSPYVTEGPPVFATAAANRLSLYACPPTGPAFTALQTYRDPEKLEEFYCTAWLYDEEKERHLVATGGKRGLVRVVDPHAGLCISTLIGHGNSVNELRVHPRHSMILASASQDYTVRLWNVRLEACLAIVGAGDGHVDQILSMDFNLDGSLLVTCSMDHSVKVWATGAREFSDQSIDAVIEQSLALPKSRKAELRLVQSPFPSGSSSDLHRNYVDCVRFCGLRYLLSKSCDESICLWRFGELEGGPVDPVLPGLKAETNVCLLSELVIEDCDIWFLKFGVDPAFKMLASGNKLGALFVWPIGEEMGHVEPVKLTHKKCRFPVRQVEWSPDSRILIAVADDGTIWRWNVVPKKSSVSDD